MNLGIIILAVFCVPAIVLGSALVCVGTDAILHGRAITRDVAIAMGLTRGLRATYADTVRQSLPDDLLVLLGKLRSLPDVKQAAAQ